MRSSTRAPFARLGLLAITTCGAAAPARGQDEKSIELPIRSVVLYKHGLGYFERTGSVEGNGVAALRFSAGQMNDVLKTLTALDLDGGRISTIGYDSKAPAARLLGEFGFELPPQGALVAVLRMFRGAQVEVKLAAQTLVGAIVGVESRQVPSGERVAEVARITLLTDEGEAVSFDTTEIQSVRFLDRELSEDLRRYLEILRDSYRADRKSMQLRLAGEGARDVFVSYAVEVPVWKASYRLVLGERDLLQGWAIVDNTSDEDWDDVELSLVAGLPVSFVLDLYTPRYTRRPVVEIEEELAVAPQTHEAGWKQLEQNGYAAGEEAESEERADAARAPGRGAAKADFAARKSVAERRRAALDAPIAPPTTVTREVGELFEYRIDHPVTVKRNRSALIPIVGAAVEAEELALFNERIRARNPLSAVRLRNTTGLTLEGGAVTVLEGETYAGEALIETLEPKQERYVTYAVDLAITVDTKQESGEERVVRARFLNGVLWLDSRIVATTGYAIRNGHQPEDGAQRIVIEHARRPGFELLAPAQALEETPEHWRFAVDVEPGKSALFTVEEEYAQQTQLAITNLSSDEVDHLVRRRVLSAEMEQALREVIGAKAELAELERRAQKLAAEIQQLAQDQERLRKNLSALGTTAAEQQLRGRYVDQLGRSEDRIAALTAEKQQLEATIAEKRTRLDERIRGLALESRG